MTPGVNFGDWPSNTPLTVPLASGLHFHSPVGLYLRVGPRSAQSSMPLSTEMAMPFVISRAMTVDRARGNVVNTGGSSIRFGLREADEYGRPSTLIADLGTINCGSLGFRESSFGPISLDSGLHWVSATKQGSGGVIGSNNSTPNYAAYFFAVPNPGSEEAHNVGIQSGADRTGALPSSWGSTYTISPEGGAGTPPPEIYLRIAS